MKPRFGSDRVETLTFDVVEMLRPVRPPVFEFNVFETLDAIDAY